MEDCSSGVTLTQADMIIDKGQRQNELGYHCLLLWLLDSLTLSYFYICL